MDDLITRAYLAGFRAGSGKSGNIDLERAEENAIVHAKNTVNRTYIRIAVCWIFSLFLAAVIGGAVL